MFGLFYKSPKFFVFFGMGVRGSKLPFKYYHNLGCSSLYVYDLNISERLLFRDSEAETTSAILSLIANDP